ncbi:MAG: hypothetical protein JW870_02910 [Candidatus Delongbacteria bacterium]|nr:hypothetical protein [Candidatus Delongbacteria bacterium]
MDGSNYIKLEHLVYLLFFLDENSNETMKYRVFINGKNFLIKENDNSVERLGFFTNVFIEAESQYKAEHMALQILRDDKELKEIVINSQEDLPILTVEEICELEDWPVGISFPRTGLSLYPEEEEE